MSVVSSVLASLVAARLFGVVARSAREAAFICQSFMLRLGGGSGYSLQGTYLRLPGRLRLVPFFFVSRLAAAKINIAAASWISEDKMLSQSQSFIFSPFRKAFRSPLHLYYTINYM